MYIVVIVQAIQEHSGTLETQNIADISTCQQFSTISVSEALYSLPTFEAIVIPQFTSH